MRFYSSASVDSVERETILIVIVLLDLVNIEIELFRDLRCK